MNLTQAKRAGLLAVELDDIKTIRAAVEAAAEPGKPPPPIEIRFALRDDDDDEMKRLSNRRSLLPYDMALGIVASIQNLIERELDFLGVDVKSMEDANG